MEEAQNKRTAVTWGVGGQESTESAPVATAGKIWAAKYAR